MTQEDAPQPPKKPDDLDVWRLAFLGTQLAITVGIFVGAGWLIDRKFDCSPWGAAILGILGVFAGLYYFIKEASR